MSEFIPSTEAEYRTFLDDYFPDVADNLRLQQVELNAAERGRIAGLDEKDAHVILQQLLPEFRLPE